MSDADKQINPYESPHTSEPKANSNGFQITFGFVLALMLTGLLPVAIFFSRGRAIQTFVDFDIELPTLTRWAISWAFVLLTCGLFLFTLVKEFVLPPVMSTRMLNSLSSLAAVLLGLFYAFAVGMAFIDLIHSLA